MGKDDERKESSQSEEYPDWLAGQQRRSSGSGILKHDETEHGTIPREREVQFRGSIAKDHGKGQTKRGMRIRRPKSGRKNRSQNTGNDETTRQGKLNLTLDELRKSLDTDMLKSLVDGSYNPHELITIHYKLNGSASKLVEDSFRGPIKRQRSTKRVKKAPIPPSVKFGKLYNRFTKGELALDASVVFGRYLLLYKELFGEEDPAFINKSTASAIYAINEMSMLLTDGDFTKILEFIDKLMPLWAKRLRKGADFPTGRPTFKTFFVKRGIWTQRFNLYRKWK